MNLHQLPDRFKGFPLGTFFAFGNAEKVIDELREVLVDLNEQIQTIQATADAEKRDLSEDETKEIEKLMVEFDDTVDNIERRQRIASQTNLLKQSTGTVADRQSPEPTGSYEDDPDPEFEQVTRAQSRRRKPGAARIDVVSVDRGKWGFRGLGDFAQAVRFASAKGGTIDPRLVANAPTTVSTEGAGADGGFAVPPDFRREIWEKVMGDTSLISLCDQFETGSNTFTVPVDETTPWDENTGVQAYWESEMGQITQSKIALQERIVRLNRLTALVPVTEDLLEDAPGLDSYLRRKVPTKFDYKLNKGIISGTGVGQPLGLLNAGCLVSVAKESSQPADTLWTENVVKMYARMPAQCLPNSYWLCNQDIFPQLMLMTVRILNAAGTDYVGGGPVFIPPGGLASAPYGMLLGRPIRPTAACKTLGDKGDLIFADLTQYMAIFRSRGIRTDVSMHLWFDYALMAYRFILRFAGQPWWNTYITPANGTNNQSCIVTLDERA